MTQYLAEYSHNAVVYKAGLHLTPGRAFIHAVRAAIRGRNDQLCNGRITVAKTGHSIAIWDMQTNKRVSSTQITWKRAVKLKTGIKLQTPGEDY